MGGGGEKRVRRRGGRFIYLHQTRGEKKRGCGGPERQEKGGLEILLRERKKDFSSESLEKKKGNDRFGRSDCCCRGGEFAIVQYKHGEKIRAPLFGRKNLLCLKRVDEEKKESHTSKEEKKNDTFEILQINRVRRERGGGKNDATRS